MTGDDFSQLAALARQLHGNRTKTTLQFLCSGSGMSLRHHTDGQSMRFGRLPWHEWPNALRALFPGVDENRQHLIELVLGDGVVTVGYSHDVVTASPCEVTLDPGFRLPGHPLPGMPPPAFTDAPADPEIPALVAEFVAHYTRIVGEAPELGEGNTEAAITEAERAIGARLPSDLHALYRTIHEDLQESGLLARYSVYSLDEVVGRYRAHEPGSTDWNDSPFEQGVVFDTDPAGRVKRLSRSDWWVTFASDCAGNYLAVDLDPEDGGVAGQVIEYGRDFHGPVRYVASSVKEMLTQVRDALRAGRYEYDEDEEGYLRVVALFDENNAGPVYSKVFNKPSELVVTASQVVQQVYVNDTDDLDLAAFEPLTNLRELSVNRAELLLPRVDRLPSLELLSIDAARVELGLLAGHPRLWSLSLTGIEGPVDIGVLRTLPALLKLDLSKVDVADLSVLVELPGLRVLILSASQWKVLQDKGISLPGLAAAQLAGDCSLSEAAEWTGWLTGTLPEVRTVTTEF